jgi:hypothetical protein
MSCVLVDRSRLSEVLLQTQSSSYVPAGPLPEVAKVKGKSTRQTERRIQCHLSQGIDSTKTTWGKCLALRERDARATMYYNQSHSTSVEWSFHGSRMRMRMLRHHRRRQQAELSHAIVRRSKGSLQYLSTLVPQD